VALEKISLIVMHIKG